MLHGNVTGWVKCDCHLWMPVWMCFAKPGFLDSIQDEHMFCDLCEMRKHHEDAPNPAIVISVTECKEIVQPQSFNEQRERIFTKPCTVPTLRITYCSVDECLMNANGVPGNGGTR